jgi:hypothetical protein
MLLNTSLLLFNASWGCVKSTAFTLQKFKQTILVYNPHNAKFNLPVSLLTKGWRMKGLASHQRGDNQANGGKGGH